MSNLNWLTTAAKRAVDHQWTVGSVLDEYKALEGIDDAALCTQLQCTREQLQKLALCRRPREDHYADDVTRIANHLSVDARGLAPVLRRVEVLGTLRRGARSAVATEATLLAARDRKPGDDEP
jgi:hypothetical protein